MNIKVLGPGCINCQTLEQRTIDALSELQTVADVEKITDINKFVDYNVFMTPALVINEKLKVSGRVPGKEEIKKWIQEELS
jgi:small redox-active disulfide protein 2